VEVFVRRSLQLSLFAVVLLGLIGGTLAYFAAQKSVTLTVDGQQRTVATYAGTVGEILREEGLEPAAHDVVLPGPAQEVADGDTVVVNRARPLELTVDGVSREVYVTALSVDEALAQLGYRADGLVLSASRSERLPLDGMQLTITTPKEVVLVSDGQERVVSTTAATAGDLLADQGIALSGTDRTSVYLGQGLLNRMRVQVFRVQVSESTVTKAIPHERVESADPEALEGTKKVTREGVDGEEASTVRVTVVDGVETARETLNTSVTRQQVPELVAVGSKPRPASTPSAGSSSGNSPSADGLNWAALAKCESGGRADAVSATGKYHGLYQFSVATWQAVGGTGLPSQASPDEQTYRAQLLYNKAGAGQWPHCGKNL
jgi:predicted ribosomally synthesized peptide with SipW-like signal peptide